MNNSMWDSSAPTGIVRFPAKRLRARIIADHINKAGYAGAVIFTCGNAADALRVELHGQKKVFGDSRVVEVGPQGDLHTGKWWTPEEIRRAWPNLFDATSGHLPLTLMVRIAADFKTYWSQSDTNFDGVDQLYVPTGSGETILCLHMAFPEKKFCAVYDNDNAATTRDNDAPLNEIIDRTFRVEYWHGKLAV